MEAAFYKQLEILNGAVKHSGDNKTGDKVGDDESIQVDVDRLPNDVHLIMFVVSAYSGGTFKNVETARVELRDCLGGQK